MMKVNKTYEIIKVVFIYNTGCLYIGDEIIYKYRIVTNINLNNN